MKTFDCTFVQRLHPLTSSFPTKSLIYAWKENANKTEQWLHESLPVRFLNFIKLHLRVISIFNVSTVHHFCGVNCHGKKSFSKNKWKTAGRWYAAGSSICLTSCRYVWSNPKHYYKTVKSIYRNRFCHR